MKAKISAVTGKGKICSVFYNYQSSFLLNVLKFSVLCQSLISPGLLAEPLIREIPPSLNFFIPLLSYLAWPILNKSIERKQVYKQIKVMEQMHSILIV